LAIGVDAAALPDSAFRLATATAVLVGLAAVLDGITTAWRGAATIGITHLTQTVGHLSASRAVRTQVSASSATIDVALETILDVIVTGAFCTMTVDTIGTLALRWIRAGLGGGAFGTVVALIAAVDIRFALVLDLVVAGRLLADVGVTEASRAIGIQTARHILDAFSAGATTIRRRFITILHAIVAGRL
jgi:hypothetical protein